MNEYSLRKITSFKEFAGMEDEWKRFTDDYFPDRYSRSHQWLSAYWKTYHAGNSSEIYILSSSNQEFVAAAPLHRCKENFGGFPVRSLSILGRGIGREGFLISQGTRDFLTQIMNAIGKSGWDIIRLSRVDKEFAGALEEAATASGFVVETIESTDYLVNMPSDYGEFLRGRSRKFRRNLNQAENRLEREGTVEFLVLDPFRDTAQVLDAGMEIARQSWQYLSGVSHFSQGPSGSFYENLTRRGKGAGGEDFNLLLVSGKPVAYLLGCLRGRTYYAIDTGFHKDYQAVSAGRVLFARVIQRLMAEKNTDVFDFEGAGEYKKDYATDIRTVKSLVVYNNRLYPEMIRYFRRSRLNAFAKKCRDACQGSSTRRSMAKGEPDGSFSKRE